MPTEFATACLHNSIVSCTNTAIFCKFGHGYTQSYKRLEFFCLLSTLTHAVNFAILIQNVCQTVPSRSCVKSLAFFTNSYTLREVTAVLQETPSSLVTFSFNQIPYKNDNRRLKYDQQNISRLLRQICCRQFTFPSYITQQNIHSLLPYTSLAISDGRNGSIASNYNF